MAEKQYDENGKEVATAQQFHEAAKKRVKTSKYGIVNTMTIPQLKRAKGVLKNKLGDNNLNYQTKQKMEDMMAEYEFAEKQIHKYYSAVAAHPQGRALLASGKLKTLDTLTIQNIKGLTKINGKDMGKINTGLANKIAIGAGIAMIGAGVMSMGKEDASLFALLWKLIKNLSPQNKIGLALITAGIATIGGVAIAKKIKESHRRNKMAQAKVHEAENEMYEAGAANESSVDEVALAGAKFEGQSLDNMVNALVDSPNLMTKYEEILRNDGFDKTTGKQYTAQERKNIKAAIDKARQVMKDLEADKASLDGTDPIKPEEKGEFTGSGSDTSGNNNPKPSANVAQVEQALDDILFNIGQSNADKTAGIKNIDEFLSKLEEKGLDKATIERLKAKALARKKEISEKMNGQKLRGKETFNRDLEAEAMGAGK